MLAKTGDARPRTTENGRNVLNTILSELATERNELNGAGYGWSEVQSQELA